MNIGITEQLPVQPIDIHKTAPDKPLISFLEKRKQIILLPGRKSQRSLRKQFNIHTHIRQKRKPVISHLLLGTMLVKTPVTLYTFRFSQYNFRNNGIPCCLYQSIILLQQSPDQHISCQPHFILTSHPKPGIFHFPDSIHFLIRTQFILQQQKSRTQSLGNPDLIIPPV